MRIPLPAIPQWFNHLLDWVNVPFYKRDRFEVRRIDVALVFFGVACVSWYAWTGGWQGALVGGSMYVLVTMIVFWFF
jgi:hypothetical protein